MTRYELEQQVREFREQGYTVFSGLVGPEFIAECRAKYASLLRESRFVRGEDLIQSPSQRDIVRGIWILSMLEKVPELTLRLVANPVIVDFAERIVGPFVQIDSAVLAGWPPTEDKHRGEVRAWHRDRLFGWVPEDGLYVRPNSIIVMVYLQDLTEDSGPLRVIPGSHRRRVVMTREEGGRQHSEERLLFVKAGDAVVQHDNLLHSGTANVSGDTRYFFGVTYNLSWMRQEDNFSGPDCQAILARARAQNDRRLLRLMGHDEQLKRRLNSGLYQPDEEQWFRWIAEDKAAAVQTDMQATQPVVKAGASPN